MGNLLSSAPSLAEIEEAVTRYYGGQVIKLVRVSDVEWNFTRTSDGHKLHGVRVIKRRGRYRFESNPSW